MNNMLNIYITLFLYISTLILTYHVINRFEIRRIRGILYITIIILMILSMILPILLINND